MTSITDVSYDDIKLFLTTNGVRLSVSERNNYNQAFEMIKNDKNYFYPDSIVDWIVAYNFDGNISSYSKGEINLLSEDELNKLSKELGIFESNNNKQSVVNVLKYLNKYEDNFIHSDLDRNIFQIVDEQRILSGNYKEIIEIFGNNKILRSFLYDNMRRIINKRYKNIDDLFLFIVDLFLFIVDLLGLKEITLAREALKISNDLITDQDGRNESMGFLYYRVIESKNVMITENYFKLLPYIRELYGRSSFDDFEIIESLDDYLRRLPIKEYRKVIISFLVAAINIKNKIFADGAVNIWYNTEFHDNDEWFLKFDREMNNIIKVVDSI